MSLAECLHSHRQKATADLVEWRREEGSLPLTPGMEHSGKRTQRT